ncbi:MAG: DUF1761 domain-containing protein [Nitrospirota bacterium]|nr:DUF1761 domain-containing protein [Nitrospirota bacterium]
MDRIHHLAVIVAAIVLFIFGAIWYTVFANPWVAMMGKSAADMKGTPMTYILSFIISLILAYVVAIALSKSDEGSAMAGISFALFMGIGLVAVSAFNRVIYEGAPVGLWAIDSGYIVVGLAIVGAIIGGWRKRPIA